MRTSCALGFISGFGLRGNADFQPGSFTGTRFYREFALYETYSFFYYPWTFSGRFHLVLRHAARKIKATSVVFDGQLARTIGCAQPYEHVFGLAVLPHVDQSFLRDAR